MKTLLTTLSALAIVLTITSCNKDNSAPVAPEDMPIQLDANLLSKAAIAGTTFPASKDGVFYVSSYLNDEVGNEPTNFANPHFSAIGVNSDANVKLKFATDQYYHPTKALYFYAYAPVATTVIAGTETETPKAEYTLTGQEDIMSAKDITGITKDAVKASPTTVFPKFAFSHKLKQLKFKVVGGEMFTNPDVRLKSISLINTSTKAVMELTTGNLIFSEKGSLEAFASQSGFTVPKEGSDPAVIPGSIMIEPGINYMVRVEFFNGSPLEGSNTLLGEKAGEAGISHTITLTINPSAISMSASIAPWVDGSDSSLELE